MRTLLSISMAMATWVATASPAPAQVAALDMALSATQTPSTLRPGATDVVLYRLSLTWSGLVSSRRLQSLRLTNTSTGPGSIADRDAELGSVRLYRDNGNGTFDAGGVDVLLKQATAASGAVLFSGLSQTCPSGTTVNLLVVTNVPLAARDGDALDLATQSGSDLTFDQSVTYSNAFPLAPAGTFSIDGMVAAQIGVGAVGTASVIAGSANNLVHHVVLPANGYQVDQLQQLTVVNTGTAASGSEISALKAWVDDGDGGFDPARDRLVGALAFTGGNRWQLTSLAEPVPVAGLRLFLTVDVPLIATNGRSIRLALQTLPDLGVGMASANDGPLDRMVESQNERTVSTANRVTLSAASITPATARPGQRDVPLLHIAATNDYSTAQLLDRLTVANAGVGGTPAERDDAVQSLTLRADGDGNGALGDSLTDPALASAFFSGGRATFAGFSRSLAPGTTQHLFVTSEVSLTGAADGDTLSARIDGPLDLGLPDTTRLVASWPLDSRARQAVDGMVRPQIAVVPVPSVTLAPDDANVLALDLVVPRNGRADDTLERVDLVNLGTALQTDLAEVRLWRDGGDGIATPGAGDDRDLGEALWAGASWRSSPLAEPLGVTGARLFAVIRVASSPVDSSTVRLAVPVGGLAVASGNDGPLDIAATSPIVLLVSNSPLLAALGISPAASAVGQSVTVTMAVRNKGGESIQSVAPSALVPSGGGGLTLQSGPVPPSVDLAPGASDTLRWTYLASQPGTVRLSGRASGTGSPSGTPRQTLETSSGPHQVFAQATQLDAAASVSLPGTVNRGQSGIVPLTLRLTNGGGAQVSDVRFRGFRVALRDEAGGGIVPDQLLARVAVQEGTTERLARTTLESSGAEVDLTLASPVLIGPGETVDLGLTLDLRSATAVTAFRLVLSDSAWFVAEDVHSGSPVTVRFAAPPLPIATGLARVVEAPTRLEITALPGSTTHAGAGQREVPLLGVRLLNPGTAGITNDVRVAALALDASDTLGVALARLADAVSWLRIGSGGQTIASRGVFAADGALLTLSLSPALSVPVNTPIDLFVSGDISATAGPGAFRLRLADSTRVDARDASTRDPVRVVLVSDPLPGPVVIVEARAESVWVRGTARFPTSVRAGDPNVTAITVALFHPGGAGTAPVRMDSLVVLSRDEARRPLVPASYLSRIRALWNGAEAGIRPDPPSSGDATGLTLGGRLLAPGDSAVLELVVDLSAVAPEGFLELSVLADGLVGRDLNLGSRVTVAPWTGELPLISGLTRIQAPARTLRVGLASLMPATLAGDGRGVAAATLSLANQAPAGSGTISVESLVVRAADRAAAGITLGAMASAVTILQGGQGGTVWGQGAAVAGDTTVTVSGATPLVVAPGVPVALELRFTPRAGVRAGSLRLGLTASDVRVIQPGSALLQIEVQPAAGMTFPLWSEAGSFAPTELAASYSNFPNPFPAGRGVTRFAYFLRAPARTWLRLVALDGEPVITLLDGVSRDAGMHEQDQWDGRNGAGRPVRNGAYVAELVIQYDDGSRERALRKVAVVR